MAVASSIAYLVEFWGYPPIKFGRPTILLVYTDTDPVILTPLMEGEIAYAMTWFSDLET